MDLKLVMGLKRFNVLGLVDIFLQKDEGVIVAGYMWYGRNRENGKRSSGDVEVLVNMSSESRVSSVRDGLVWVELKGEGRRKLMIGVIYVNPEGVRVEEMERLFGCRWMHEHEEKVFDVVMGNFYPRIGLGAEDHPNSNGKRRLDLVRLGDFVVWNKFSAAREGAHGKVGRSQ